MMTLDPIAPPTPGNALCSGIKIHQLIGAMLLITLVCGCGRGTPENPVRVPPSELRGSKGSLTVYSFVGQFDLYNASDWNVVAVDVTITDKRSDDKRLFRFWSKRTEEESGNKKEVMDPIKPLSAGILTGDLGNFGLYMDEKQMSWTFDAVYGFR